MQLVPELGLVIVKQINIAADNHRLALTDNWHSRDDYGWWLASCQLQAVTASSLAHVLVPLLVHL